MSGSPGMNGGPEQNGDIWDPGMHNERTRLAWQRTTLSGLACGLVVARLVSSASLALAIVVGLASIATTALLGWLTMRRYAVNQKNLHAAHPLTDARAHLGVTVLLVVTGVGALVYVFAQFDGATVPRTDR